MIVRHNTDGTCVKCRGYHGAFYTQGCSQSHPTAFPKHLAENTYPTSRLESAHAGAVPVGIDSFSCNLALFDDPHQHPQSPFRWVE